MCVLASPEMALLKGKLRWRERHAGCETKGVPVEALVEHSVHRLVLVGTRTGRGLAVGAGSHEHRRRGVGCESVVELGGAFQFGVINHVARHVKVLVKMVKMSLKAGTRIEARSAANGADSVQWGWHGLAGDAGDAVVSHDHIAAIRRRESRVSSVLGGRCREFAAHFHLDGLDAVHASILGAHV